MKLTELSLELAKKLEAAWAKNAPHMPDYARDPAFLSWVVLESDSQWYQVGDHQAWLYIRNIVPGLQADLHALNLDGKHALDRALARKELLAIMREHDLRRLNVVLPAPVQKVIGAVTHLGFTEEGRMRDGMVFNGKFADSVLFGLLRREVEHDEIASVAPPPNKKKRRRRRSRRKSMQGKGAKWETQAQTDKYPKLEESSARLSVAPSSSAKPVNGKDNSYSIEQGNSTSFSPSTPLPKVL